MRFECKVFWICVVNLLGIIVFLTHSGLKQAAAYLVPPLNDAAGLVVARWIMGTTLMHVLPFLMMLMALLFIGGEAFLKRRHRQLGP